MTTVAELGVKATADGVVSTTKKLDKLDRSAERAEMGVKGFSKASKRMGGVLGSVAGKLGLFAAGLVSVGAAKAAITSAKSFSSALSEVSTLLEGTAEQTAALESESRRLARAYGSDATSQASAFYQAISAGAGDVTEATLLLESANKLAIGGVTDVTTGVDALTTAMNAYAASGLTAAQASDALFVGIKAGKTTAAELSASLGNIVPIASAVGVSFDEVVAGVAALTTQGQTTSVAVTGLRQVLVGVVKPTKEAADMAKALGIEFNGQALEAKGLVGFLDDVITKTGGNQAAMAKLFGSVEALNAVLAFAGGAGDAFATTMQAMGEKAGATQTAFDKMSEGMSQRLNIQMGLLRDATTAVGGVLLATLVPALEATSGLIGFVSENFDILLAVMFTAAATQIPLVAGAIATMTAGFSASAAAVGVSAAAMAAFNIVLRANPIGLAITAVAALGSAFFVMGRRAKVAGGKVDEATEFVNDLLGPAIGATSVTEQLAGGFTGVGSAANTAATGINTATTALDNWIAKGKEAGVDIGNFIDPSMALGGGPLKLDITAIEDFLSGGTSGGGKFSGRGTSAGAGSTELERILLRLGGENTTLPSATGGGGGAASLENDFADRLDVIREGLRTEKETVDEWRAGALATLNEGRANGLIAEADFNTLRLGIEGEYWDRLREIRANGIAGALGQTSEYFGDLNSLAGGGYSGLLKAQKIFAAAEALVNTYRAGAQTLADPSIPFWGKIAAVGSIIASGMGMVNAIKGGGTASASSSGASTTSAAPTQAAQSSTPQRVLLDFQGRGMISVEMLDEIISGLQSASKNGVIIEVAT